MLVRWRIFKAQPPQLREHPNFSTPWQLDNQQLLSSMTNQPQDKGANLFFGLLMSFKESEEHAFTCGRSNCPGRGNRSLCKDFHSINVSSLILLCLFMP